MRDMLEAAARECGLVLTGDMLDALTEYWRYLVERPGSAALIRAGGRDPAAPSPHSLPDAART